MFPLQTLQAIARTIVDQIKAKKANMDLSDSFKELAPESELQELVEENKRLEDEIEKLSFTSLKQKSKTNSTEALEKATDGTTPKLTSLDKENEISFFETTFKPLPFEKNETTIDSSYNNTTSKPHTVHESYGIDEIPLYRPADDQTTFTNTSTFPPKNNVPGQNAQSLRKALDKHDEAARRLVGEIAFQLDRRILQHVFSYRKRLYGFTVRNITQKISEYTEDFETGKIDHEKRQMLTEKRNDLFHFLQLNVGYNPKYHPIFSEMLVNKFGVLKINPSKNSPAFESLQQPDYVKSTMLNTLDPEYTYDALILLDALVLFSNFDKKSLLVW